MSEHRYLWFAPHAGLWPSYRLEHRLADSLARAGRAVTLIGCGGVLDTYCPVMSADRVPATAPRSVKRRSCRDCQFNASIATSRGAYDVEWLDSYVDDDVRRRADELLTDVTQESWTDLHVDGIPVGRYSAYLTMLHHKLPDPTSSPAAWQEYLSDLRNALHVALAMPALLDHVRPTHAVVYNALYPTTRMFAERSMRYGAQFVGLHAGSYIPARYETVGIYQHLSASQTLVDSPSIRASLDVPTTVGEADAVGIQLRELVAGNDPWVYSNAPQRRDPADLRRVLGLREGSPVVVALLSSPDETRSSMLVDAEYHRDPERGYSDISEFIRALRRLAEDCPDLDVVLRLHPRLLPNKREAVSSPDLQQILAALDDLPANARINAPADGLSLYDLIGIASAAVNQSSSAGLEFLVLGLPVVSYDPVRQNAYPPEFGVCVERHDPDALARAVRAAVADGGELASSVRAVRWLATTQLRAMLLMSPVVAEAGDQAPPVAAAGPTVAAPGGLPDSVRRVIPESARERAARWLSRRARAATLPDSADEQSWQAEWLRRLDATVGSAVVWEPPIVVRGTPDPEGEAVRVAALVQGLRESLGFLPGQGFGPVATPPRR